jgi:hypothetical protein
MAATNPAEKDATTVDPIVKAAATTDPMMALMKKGEGDESVPAEQGPAPGLTGVCWCQWQEKRDGRRYC